MVTGHRERKLWWLGPVRCGNCGQHWRRCEHFDARDVQRVGRQDEAIGRTVAIGSLILAVLIIAGSLTLMSVL